MNSNSISQSAIHRRLYQSNSQTANLASTGGMTKRVISKEEWNARLAEVHVDREDLNKLVMNYLIIEGFKDAAEKFSQESGTKPPVNLESIQDRMVVRTAIQRGQIEEAIERVNDLNPEPEFLSELERTMSLLAFELNGPSPVSDLLTPGQRQKLASELNSALLLSQSQEKDPKLPALLKTCWWSQQQLDERCTYPKIKDFTKAELVMEPMGSSSIGGSASANAGAGSSGTASGTVAGA
ncbi:hypothetical protein BGZ68_003450 [Mortierella alpina]|nr:hypothetical protein BGZ68_003450 [Mortierella alpina]